MTEKMIESEHPYPYDSYIVEKILIKNAPYLLLSFSKESTLGHNRKNAKLMIYKDENLLEEILVINPGDTFPGNDGLKPLLIKNNSVYIVLFSPLSSPEGRTCSIEEEYGYKLYIQAPVSISVAIQKTIFLIIIQTVFQNLNYLIISNLFKSQYQIY